MRQTHDRQRTQFLDEPLFMHVPVDRNTIPWHLNFVARKYEIDQVLWTCRIRRLWMHLCKDTSRVVSASHYPILLKIYKLDMVQRP